MKKLIALLLALPILCCAQSNILTGNIASFGMAGRTNLEMQLSIVSPKHRVINNIFISDDSIISSSDTNGNFSFTNIAFGYYILSASDSTGSRWPILVFTDTAGITQLKSLINFNAAMPQNGGSNYYTIAQINSMFAALSVSANTNALTQDQSDRLAMALTNAAAFWTNNDVNGKALRNNLSIYDMQDNIPLYLQSGTNVNTGWSFPLGDHAFYLSGPGGGGFSFSTLGGSNILGGVSAPAYYSGSGSLLTGIPTNSIDSIFYGLLLAGGNGGNAVANSNGFATNAFLLRPTISVPALPGGENSGAATLVVNTNDNTVGWQPIVPAPTLGNAAGASTNTMKVASATNADIATTATTASTATNATSGGNIITNDQPVVNFPQSITTSNLVVKDDYADISWSIYEDDYANLYINSAGFGGSIIFDPASPISGNGSGLTGIMKVASATNADTATTATASGTATNLVAAGFGVISKNICYLSQAYGSASPVVGDPANPFLTAQSAASNCPVGGAVVVMDGSYAETVLVTNTPQTWFFADGTALNGWLVNGTNFNVYGLGTLGIAASAISYFTNYSSLRIECKNWLGVGSFTTTNAIATVQILARDYAEGLGARFADTNVQSYCLEADYITNLITTAMSSSLGVNPAANNKTYCFKGRKSIAFGLPQTLVAGQILTNVSFYLKSPQIYFNSTLGGKANIMLSSASAAQSAVKYTIEGADLNWTSTSTTNVAVVQLNAAATNDIYWINCRFNLGPIGSPGANLFPIKSIGLINMHYMGCVNITTNFGSANVVNLVDNTLVDSTWTNTASRQ